MSLDAYRTVSTQAENPRETEYRLFGEVTRALMEAEKAQPDDIAARVGPLDWNRRVWSALATDCADESNTLPAPLRAQLISLSMWVSRHTSEVIRKKEEIAPLIDINRIIMQGLATRPAAA